MHTRTRAQTRAMCEPMSPRGCGSECLARFIAHLLRECIVNCARGARGNEARGVTVYAERKSSRQLWGAQSGEGARRGVAADDGSGDKRTDEKRADEKGFEMETRTDVPAAAGVCRRNARRGAGRAHLAGRREPWKPVAIMGTGWAGRRSVGWMSGP